MLYQLSYSRSQRKYQSLVPPKYYLVGRGGFEPPKPSATDLQSVPFDRSGTSPENPHQKKNRARKAKNSLSGLFRSVLFPIKRRKTYTRPQRAFWSWRRELNPQPTDYKSVALPIELRQPGTSPAQIFRRLIILSACDAVKGKMRPKAMTLAHMNRIFVLDLFSALVYYLLVLGLPRPRKIQRGQPCIGKAGYL